MNLLDFLFPRRCIGCGKLGKYFCQKCSAKIKLIAQPICPVCERNAISGITHPRCQTRYTLDGLSSFFRYDGIIRSAIKKIKYRFASDLSTELINLIPSTSISQLTIRQLADQFNNETILTPIPLHPTRLRFRGFNQAEILGKLLAKRLNIPLKSETLRRVKKSRPQVEMKDRKKRLSNMEGSFSLSPNILISQYPSILMFDDVFTTGATLRSAANVLKRAGAIKVWGITLAHG